MCGSPHDFTQRLWGRAEDVGMTTRTSLSSSVLLMSLLSSACSIFGASEDIAAPPPASEEADAGTADNPPAPEPPPLSGTPLVGVFVSASRGVADSDGAKNRPLKTLASAIALAKTRKQPVYACAETYNEALVLVDGVSLFGYFDCSGAEWTRVAAHATIASPTSPAVRAENLLLNARFEGFDVAAPDFAGNAEPSVPAKSSIGMLIKSSKNLGIANAIVRSGKAQGGADGVEPPSNVELNGTDIAGNTAYRQAAGCVDLVVGYCQNTKQYELGSRGGTSKCTVGPNGGPGGAGGDAAFYVGFTRKTGGAEFHGLPLVANATTAAGGALRSGGANGSAGANGVAGANGSWGFAVDGTFTPANGTAGGNGQPGLGGGGGGGSDFWQVAGGATSPPNDGNQYHYAGTGGGGGAGGCGGLAGTPGTGGGASVALLVIDSASITIEETRIESGAGGRAGKGALGTIGNQGGVGGGSGSPAYEWGGAGGSGGAGGAGGPSGHGSAGPSIAMAFHGTRPTLKGAVDLIAGTPGDGQPALVRADRSVPAVAGEAKKEHSF